MLLRRLILALLALALSACATPPVPGSSSAATLAPPSQATAAPAVASTAIATAQAVIPTISVPTTILESSAAPTAMLAPTNAIIATLLVATAAPTAPVVDAPAATTAPTAATAQIASNTATAAHSELLFLRHGALVALDPTSGSVRKLVDGVRSFTATPNGSLIAIVRGQGRNAEIWTLKRDGSALTRRTNNDRADVTPSLAADGSAIVFAEATSPKPYTQAWPDWGQWCATSEVRLIDFAASAVRTLGAGCDPAFAPDGKRIAFATPPTKADGEFPNSKINTIRLVNRAGLNGWSFAKVDPASATGGLLVYAPSWSADGANVAFQRFLGYQSLVDLGMSEIAPAFKGGGTPISSGAGWQLPIRFSPDSAHVAIIENNYSDARGWGGYDNWSVTVVALAGERQIALPLGPLTVRGAQAETLPRAQAAAWSPDGKRLAVLLPSGWRPDLPADQPANRGAETPGELWLWQPGSAPQQRLATEVDFASPVVWLRAS